jgi:glucose/arabinose dehydrogenase
MNKKLISSGCCLAMTMLLAAFVGCNNGHKPEEHKQVKVQRTKLKLPPGFVATIVADSLGAVRHLVVNEQGDIYVKLNALKDGKGVYFLSDTDHDGFIDTKTGFGDYPGTGIKIKGDMLYAASNTGVFRYKLNQKGEVISPDQPDVIVQGLQDKHRDNSKSIALDDQNNLFVTIGSYSDDCRIAGSGKGMPGCPILDSAAGIWKFKADKFQQTYHDGIHYARGIKNAVGIDWNSNTRSLFSMQHGRGQFDDKFPQYYTPKQSAELPAETMYEVHPGTDAGWPFVYYDQFQKKKILAPEYGGDGKKAGDKKFQDPIAAFPAHFAPNDLLFYTGSMFPEKYKNGAFIVFHGQSPQLKKGYLVAFVPFKNGKPFGDWEIFADNFAGEDLQKPPKPFEYRPMGLAQGPDGSLYVSDNLKGSIFKIIYEKK